MARDNTSYDGIKDRHRSQQGIAPRGERAGARKSREREIWAEENEKKDRKPRAPDRSKQKANIPLCRKPRTALKAHGQQAQGRPDHRQKPRDRERRTPNLASHEGATGAGRTQEEPLPTEHGGRRGGKREDPGRPLANKETLRAGATKSVERTLSTPRQKDMTTTSRRSSKNSTKREQGGRGACEEPAASGRRATKYRYKS